MKTDRQRCTSWDVMDQHPVVTIITVTYNSGKTLKKTLESIAKQTYKNIELIVIDGGSTDETLKIVFEYERYISYWVSEPDTGIYNAMNKGIDHATGELIYFLNADDYFYDNCTVEDVVNLYNKFDRPDVIYGDVMTYSAARKEQRRSGRKRELQELGKGRVICHQSIFMKNQLLQKYRFNEEYRIAADYEMQIKCLQAGCKFVYIDRIIAYYCIDGISSSPDGKRKTIHEKIQIIKKHFDVVTFYQFYVFAKLKLLRMTVRVLFRDLFKQNQ